MRYGFVVCALAIATMLSACAGSRTNSSGGGSAGGQVSDSLAAVIADVASVDARLSEGDGTVARTLPHDIDVLTRAINAREGDAQAMLLLHFYRGKARLTLNSLGQMLGMPVDRQMAEAAMADFDVVNNTSGTDDMTLGLRREALYYTGQILLSQLKQSERAYSYFAKCADLKQAGCLNVMAWAKVSGEGGVQPNLKEAVALHMEVYKTGTDYMCAGAFSARSLARIVHFTGVRPDENDEYAWIRRSYRLLDQVKISSKGNEPCGSVAAYQIDEYLMRLEGGEKRPSLLTSILSDGTRLSDAERTTIRYVMGDADDREFRKLADGKKGVARCEYAFLGLWKSAISKQVDGVRSYKALMQDEKAENACGYTLVFARKFE